MLGYYEGEPAINPEEVNAWKWMALQDIQTDLQQNPDKYTAWFKIIFDRFYKHISKNS
jgi:isopentenyl-diphosphate delta-isomerase